MLEVIIQSAKNFAQHQMEGNLVDDDIQNSEPLFISYIDVTLDGGDIKRVFIGCHKEILEKLAYIMLFEENCDDEVLRDMMLETANLVIGSAKVLGAESYDVHFNISTPHFEKISPFDLDTDEMKILSLDSKPMILASKSL
jgi:hypothetical protein